MAISIPVFASGQRVIVEGGPDALGATYSWTVTNQSSTPIVGVAFPHYRASLFFAPKGWTTSCTNLVAVGSHEAPGVCTAKAASAGEGISPGRSAQFGLQMGAATVKRGSAEVVIELADSSKISVGDVAVPVPERWNDKYISLIGLGAILAIFILVQTIRGRKRQRPATGTSLHSP